MSDDGPYIVGAAASMHCAAEAAPAMYAHRGRDRGADARGSYLHRAERRTSEQQQQQQRQPRGRAQCHPAAAATHWLVAFHKEKYFSYSGVEETAAEGEVRGCAGMLFR